ncbi:MAG: glutamine amidotransferase [Pseudomonadales bacterium]|nr:glutamine amidotransferase [Pseudomonadales bacterium]
MSKPFLIIQLRPEDAAADNELLKIRQYGGLAEQEIKRLRAEREGLPPINLDNYAAIIVGGSPFDVSKPKAEKTAQQIELEESFGELFAELKARDFPFLGCCSGNGLLGSWLGASISGKYAEPVGAIELELTEEGAQDPLLADFPPRFRALAGHKEACDQLPPDSVLLATNSQCPVQMFRVRTNIYATQFHPEGDPEGFILRINIYKNHGYFPPESAEKLIEAVENEATPQAHLILRRFVERYRQD